jgi:hypothetical protein
VRKKVTDGVPVFMAFLLVSKIPGQADLVQPQVWDQSPEKDRIGPLVSSCVLPPNQFLHSSCCGSHLLTQGRVKKQAHRIVKEQLKADVWVECVHAAQLAHNES